MAEARARVIISGIVQGVFFRYNTCNQAERFKVTGWAKNRWDGKVEALLEGEKEDVEKLIAWCHQGPPGAQVDKVEVKWEEYKGEFNSFSIAW
jgi:acylphosphatase